jgi:hypothetical protein
LQLPDEKFRSLEQPEQRIRIFFPQIGTNRSHRASTNTSHCIPGIVFADPISGPLVSHTDLLFLRTSRRVWDPILGTPSPPDRGSHRSGSTSVGVAHCTTAAPPAAANRRWIGIHAPLTGRAHLSPSLRACVVINPNPPTHAPPVSAPLLFLDTSSLPAALIIRRRCAAPVAATSRLSRV